MKTNHAAAFNSLSVHQQTPANGRCGFTLTELLVVLATLGILVVVLLPSFAGIQPGSSRAFQCLNNMRQLGLAESLYANENHDKLASNNDEFPETGANKSKNWICPYGVTLDWSANQRNTNTLYLTLNSPTLGTALFGGYLANSVNIYVCPADNYLSANQQKAFAAAGLTHRIRSCSMNGAMGDGSKWFSAADGGGGNWPAFYNVKKTSDMHNPVPANCWLITDEHPDSNDDAVFYLNPADANSSGDNTFTELPGSMHNNGAGMVFADGHSEVHVWQGRLTTQPVTYLTYLNNVIVTSDVNSRNDLTWFAQHTPAN